MKVLVIGAAGRTGRATVQEAAAAGHQVTALVRRDTVYSVPGVTVHIGDATDLATVAAAVAGQGAVIDTVGGKTPYRHTTLETEIVEAIIAAMQGHSVRRLIISSSLGVGDSSANASFLTGMVVKTFLRGSTRDKAQTESTVRNSALEWVITRPAVLNDNPATGTIRVLEAGNHERAQSLTRADGIQPRKGSSAHRIEAL